MINMIAINFILESYFRYNQLNISRTKHKCLCNEILTDPQ